MQHGFPFTKMQHLRLEYQRRNVLSWLTKQLIDDFYVVLAFISAHKLREQHKLFLDSIHNNCTSICTWDSSVVTGARCGKGGVAVMFRKTCQFSISTLDIPLNDMITETKKFQRNMRPK